jgi:hypothetical protein
MGVGLRLGFFRCHSDYSALKTDSRLQKNGGRFSNRGDAVATAASLKGRTELGRDVAGMVTLQSCGHVRAVLRERKGNGLKNPH